MAPCSQTSSCTARQAIDSAFLQFTVAQTLQRTASVHLLFAFEYVIQASIIISTFCKYMLAAIDRCVPSNPGLHIRVQGMLGGPLALILHASLVTFGSCMLIVVLQNLAHGIGRTTFASSALCQSMAVRCDVMDIMTNALHLARTHGVRSLLTGREGQEHVRVEHVLVLLLIP